MFFVPRNGTYLFYVNILSESGNFIETELVANGQRLGLMYSGSGTYHGAGSNMVIVNLSTGDNVWVRIHSNYTSDGGLHCCWSTFSGFQLADGEAAFSASLSQSLANMVAHQTIVFDHVLVNDAHLYNAASGMFYVKEPGLYVFYTTILSEHGSSIETEIMSSRGHLSHVYSGGDRHGSGSNLVIAEMAAGDNVWVKLHAAYGSQLAVHYGWSTFSGFRLAETEIAFSARLSGENNCSIFPTVFV